jgi:hypothetical protein
MPAVQNKNKRQLEEEVVSLNKQVTTLKKRVKRAEDTVDGIVRHEAYKPENIDKWCKTILSQYKLEIYGRKGQAEVSDDDVLACLGDEALNNVHDHLTLIHKRLDGEKHDEKDYIRCSTLVLDDKTLRVLISKRVENSPCFVELDDSNLIIADEEKTVKFCQELGRGILCTFAVLVSFRTKLWDYNSIEIE